MSDTEKVTADGENTENTATATATDDKKDSGRIDFDIKGAQYRNDEKQVVSAVNTEGLLIAVPKPLKDAEGKVIYAGFNCRKHVPLKKSDFASITTYMRHQAYVARVKAAILIKGAEDKEVKAARMEKFGDDATRKKVAKMARMREQLAALQTQLKEDGVDISDI